MDKAGEIFKLEWNNGEGWETLGEIRPLTEQEVEDLTNGTWSMTVDFTPISFDETWLVAYIGRMYAEYFRN